MLNRPEDITDAQWLTMMKRCSPDSRIVACFSGNVIAVRRPDGTGILVDPAGDAREIDKYGIPEKDPQDESSLRPAE